ncbi:PepSY-associated TM helix domain-containing protein [Pseudoalteromonas neustonica]|uniref:PepSY-associated TM helix domain-containing protein n=1 Tax=Pseudoalteromonas neustonica TaxID=1840331 RepID=A0ABU9U4H0_9GAMM
MKAKSWFNLHSWAGLFVGVLLFVICFSGTLATLSHEIEYLSDKKFRAISNSGETNYIAIEHTLNKTYPSAQILYIHRHKQDYLATEVALKYHDEFLFVYLDGATGTWLGEGKWARVSRFLRNWHMNLSLGWIGKLIVTSLSLLLLVLFISSFYVYRQWWLGFFKKPSQLLKTKRSSWADWHKLLGLWSLWFIAVMSITGTWYLIEHGLQTARIDHYVAEPSALRNLRKVPVQESSAPLHVATLTHKALQAFSSLDIRYIRYGKKANQAVEVRGYNNDILLRLRANRVYLHPTTGVVLGIQKGENLPIIARIKDTADPLHFGNFAGIGTKLIWTIFGLAMSFISATGMYMSWLRVKRKVTLTKWLGVAGGAATVLVVASVIVTSVSFSVRTVPDLLFAPALARPK